MYCGIYSKLIKFLRSCETKYTCITLDFYPTGCYIKKFANVFMLQSMQRGFNN